MIVYGQQLALFGWCMTGHHASCTHSSPSVSNPEVVHSCGCSCHGDQS